MLGRASGSNPGVGCAGWVSNGTLPRPGGFRSEPERTNEGKLRNESGQAF